MSSPVFVGGTGRSGTTIVARLVGGHPAMHMIPIETRFIVDPLGVCDLVRGDVQFKRFRNVITGRRWKNARPNGTLRGLHLILEEAELTTALDELEHRVADDVEGAVREFCARLLDPIAHANGAQRWVEMTPPNVARGNDLRRIFPDMKLVHSVRDGRDVAASIATKRWGPDTMLEALDWWAERLLEAHRGCDQLGPESLRIIDLERLVATDRDQTLNDLFAFLDLDVTTDTLRFFNDTVSASMAHGGRWKRAVDPSEHAGVEERYEMLLDRLDTAGAARPRDPSH